MAQANLNILIESCENYFIVKLGQCYIRHIEGLTDRITSTIRKPDPVPNGPDPLNDGLDCGVGINSTSLPIPNEWTHATIEIIRQKLNIFILKVDLNCARTSSELKNF